MVTRSLSASTRSPLAQQALELGFRRRELPGAISEVLIDPGIVGVCFLDGTDPGETPVRTGHARGCPHFTGGRYIQAKIAARETERDLSRVYALPGYCSR